MLGGAENCWVVVCIGLVFLAMAHRIPPVAAQADVRALEQMTDSDVEYLERVAEEAGIGSAGVDAPRPYVGEGRWLARTFTGARGTMRPIDVADDDADVPPAQPDPPDASLSMHVRPEPGRQESAPESDGGSGAVAVAGARSQLILLLATV